MKNIVDLLKNRKEIINSKQQKKNKDNNSINTINIREKEEKHINQSSNNDIFLKIDEKNNFKELNENDIASIKICYDRFKESEETIYSNIDKVMNKLLDKICNSNFNNDIFIISQNISKQIAKNNKIGKNNIEDMVNHLTKNAKNKLNIYKSKTLLLDSDNCEIIGSILCYSYSRLQQYKVKDINKLIELRNRIIKKNIDVVKDFVKYCNENKNMSDPKISYYWKSQRNQYICLPELIFLINRYSQVTEVEIDINLFNSLKEDVSKTLIIELTILNITWILNSLKSFKINFINISLQEILNNFYYNKLNAFCSNINENIKKNKIISDTDIYKKKWNFINTFKLELYRCLSNEESYNSLREIKTMSIHESLDSFSLLDNNRKLTINDSKRRTLGPDSLFDYLNKNRLNKLKNNKDKENDKENLKNIFENYSGLFELIMISFFSLNNYDKPINLELVMNDSYKEEFLCYFENILGVEKDNNIESIFDILLYKTKLNFINKLNIEINSLDSTTFDSLLNILFNNTQSLTSINISFFSSDVTYFPQFLYKICHKSIDESVLKNNYDSNTYLINNVTDIEEKILNNFITLYIYNLSVLFDIFQKMYNLDEVCLNFDIPSNIINKQNYMTCILKFILNVIFYYLNSTKIKKLCLLSSNTILDNRRNPNINKIIDNININEYSKLTDLSLHFQFYQISNINNFINTRLEILNIGDLDLYTFKILCDNICTPKFNINSSLEKLSIGLLNSITNFNREMKILLRRLFNIKIRNFISLSLYTNLIINDDVDYDYFIQIINNNWISQYIFLFNNKSDEMMQKLNQNVKSLIFYVPHNLEGKLLETEDVMKLQNNPITLEVDNNKDLYDDAYWYLKYLFEFVYVDKLKNDKRIKNMIMGILKYLYFVKIPKINSPFIENPK